MIEHKGIVFTYSLDKEIFDFVFCRDLTVM